MNLLGILLDAYYGPPYDGGYEYLINGEWVWFPIRNYELEVRMK